jgi:hypothetical protein
MCNRGRKLKILILAKGKLNSAAFKPGISLVQRCWIAMHIFKNIGGPPDRKTQSYAVRKIKFIKQITIFYEVRFIS